MSDYVIEIGPKPAARTGQAGVFVRNGRAFGFFAAADAFYVLERRLFKNPKGAEGAALRTFAANCDAESKNETRYPTKSTF